MFASVRESLSVSVLRNVTDTQHRTVVSRIPGRHLGLLQNAEPFENVTGTLFYNSASRSGCVTSQSQVASMSAPLAGYWGYAATGHATSFTCPVSKWATT
jgi:hypothetical protein